MGTITISELNTMESHVMRYIVYNLGLNIRPGTPKFDEQTKVWKFPLNAIIPNTVSRKDGRTRTFLFDFESIGQIDLIQKEEGAFEITHATKASVMDDMINARFVDITTTIEKEILRAGEASWGRLSWVSTFLRPLYHIITNVLVRGKIPLDYIEEKRYDKYARLLLEEGFINYYEDKLSLIATNKLSGLGREIFTKEGSDFDIAQRAVGMVFSKRYSTIKNEMQIYAPSAYVDATKAYYTDAIQCGENIAISEDELYRKFVRIGNRQVLTMGDFSFMTLISELVSAKLLDREKDEIIGNPKIFNDVIKHKETIMAHSTEVQS